MTQPTPVLGGTPAPARPRKGGARRVRGAIARLVPKALRERLHAMQSLPTTAERTAYLRLVLRHAYLGKPWPKARLDHPVRSVLFVCYGNIMRSAFAEAALREVVAQSGWKIEIRSAGTNARPNKVADARARECAREHALSLEEHRASLLDRALVDEADLIVPMDFLNAARVLTRFPDAADRVVMLGTFRGITGRALEIPDPYTGDRAQASACFTDIAGCVSRMEAALRA